MTTYTEAMRQIHDTEAGWEAPKGAYEIGLCGTWYGEASEVVEGIEDMHQAAEEATKRGAGWFWARLGEMPRKPGCVVYTA